MNIADVGAQLSWTNNQRDVNGIDKDFSFPQMVKITNQTAQDYDLPSDCFVLLLLRQQFVRVVAQEIGKTCYVFGKPVEIPSTYNGRFKLCNEQGRDEEEIKKFCSIQDAFDKHVEKFYLLEKICVTLPNNVKEGTFFTVDLLEGDEFVIKYEQKSSQFSKPASHKISAYQNPSLKNSSLLVHCTRLNKDLRMPYSLRASFSTHPPCFINESGLRIQETFSIQDIIKLGNFPLTVILASVAELQRSLDMDKVHLGMRLKLLGLAMESVVLALNGNNGVIEFADDATFILPKALDYKLNKEDMSARGDYFQQISNLVSSLILKNDPSVLEKHSKSIHYHIPLNKKPVSRIAINGIARLRHVDLSFHDINRINMENLRSSIFHNRNHCSISHSDNSSTSESLTSGNSEESFSAEFPISGLENNVNTQEKQNELSKEDQITLPDYNVPYSAIDTALTRVSGKSSPLSSVSTDDDEEEKSVEHVKFTKVLTSFGVDITVPKEIYDKSSDSLQNLTQTELTTATTVCPSLQISATEQNYMNKPYNLNIHKENNNLDDLKATPSSTPTSFNHNRNLDETELKNSQDSYSQKSSFPTDRTPENKTSSREKIIEHTLLQTVFQPSGIVFSNDVTPKSSNEVQPMYLTPFNDDWKPHDHVSIMSVREVAASLRYIGFTEEIVQFFFRERVDGSLLTQLPDELLKYDCNLSGFQIFKLRAFINGWRPKL